MSLGIEKLLGFNPLQIQPSERVDGGNVAKYAQPSAKVDMEPLNKEISPAYLDTALSGTMYTTGRGHSNFGGMRPYLA